MTQSPAYRFIMWDLDGTLVDSRRDLADGANVARQALGLPALPLDQVMVHIGHGLQRLLEGLCPDASADQLITAYQHFNRWYAQHCTDYTTLYPHIQVCLDMAQQANIRQAVVTNKPIRYAETILGVLGIRQYFHVVIGGDLIKKPAPDQLLSAMGLSLQSAAESLMIGDHHADTLGAAAAQCDAGFCGWGIGNMGESTAHYQWDQPEDLRAWFSSLTA